MRWISRPGNALKMSSMMAVLITTSPMPPHLMIRIRRISSREGRSLTKAICCARHDSLKTTTAGGRGSTIAFKLPDELSIEFLILLNDVFLAVLPEQR